MHYNEWKWLWRLSIIIILPCWGMSSNVWHLEIFQMGTSSWCILFRTSRTLAWRVEFISQGQMHFSGLSLPHQWEDVAYLKGVEILKTVHCLVLLPWLLLVPPHPHHHHHHLPLPPIHHPENIYKICQIQPLISLYEEVGYTGVIMRIEWKASWSDKLSIIDHAMRCSLGVFKDSHCML